MEPSKHASDHDKLKGSMSTVQGDGYFPIHQERIANKESRPCCGYDTRRAVFVVNIISFAFGALAILSIIMITSEKYAEQFDDDSTLATLNEIDSKTVGITIGFASLGIICNALGIYGATKINRWAVIIAGSWYFGEFFRGLVYLDLACVIMSGFFAYPHFIFWQTIPKGVMTPTKCPREQSFCAF